MGADTSRIEAIEAAVKYSGAEDDPEFDALYRKNGVAPAEQRRAIFLTEDLPRIERVLSGRLYKLLIIDPLNAYIPASVDSAKDNAIRSTLAPLVMMAERYGVAGLAVRPLTKGGRGKTIYPRPGSVGYTAGAPVGLLARQGVQKGRRPGVEAPAV